MGTDHKVVDSGKQLVSGGCFGDSGPGFGPVLGPVVKVVSGGLGRGYRGLTRANYENYDFDIVVFKKVQRMFSVGRSLLMNYDFVSVIFKKVYRMIDIDGAVQMKCLYSTIFHFAQKIGELIFLVGCGMGKPCLMGDLL